MAVGGRGRGRRKTAAQTSRQQASCRALSAASPASAPRSLPPSLRAQGEPLPVRPAPTHPSVRSSVRSLVRTLGPRRVRGTFVNSCAPSPRCLHGRRRARRAFAQSARTEHGAGARAPRTVAAGVGPGQQGQRQASLQPVRGVERTVLVTQGERRLPPPSRSPAASCARRLPLTAHAPQAPVPPFPRSEAESSKEGSRTQDVRLTQRMRVQEMRGPGRPGHPHISMPGRMLPVALGEKEIKTMAALPHPAPAPGTWAPWMLASWMGA